MNTYWHKHPRQFANECDIWRADSPEQVAALEDAGFTNLTYAEARAHVAWINSENRAIGYRSHTNWHDVTHADSYSARHFLDDTQRQAEADANLDAFYDSR